MIKIIYILCIVIFFVKDTQASIRVIDGDAIKIEDISIRLQGVDAPEIMQKCYDKKGIKQWDCGKAAKAFVEGLVAGRDVECRIEDKLISTEDPLVYIKIFEFKLLDNKVKGITFNKIACFNTGFKYSTFRDMCNIIISLLLMNNRQNFQKG